MCSKYFLKYCIQNVLHHICFDVLKSQLQFQKHFTILMR